MNSIISELEKIISIDSPTGFTKTAAQYSIERLKALG